MAAVSAGDDSRRLRVAVLEWDAAKTAAAEVLCVLAEQAAALQWDVVTTEVAKG